MCYHTSVVCFICATPVGRWIQPTCTYEFQQGPGHKIFYFEDVIRPRTPYSCPNPNCIAHPDLHSALRKQQENAMQQGKAYSKYIPFNQTKSSQDDNDEACDLALDVMPGKANIEVRPTFIKGEISKRLQNPPSYPPDAVPGARLSPTWLTGKQFRAVFTEYWGGKSDIHKLADLVCKNSSLLRIYIDTYIKSRPDDIRYETESPLSEPFTESSEYEDGLFLFDEQEILVEQPEPNRQKNFTGRRLLKLQAEQRDAENRGVAIPAIDTPNVTLTPQPASPEASNPGPSEDNELEALLGVIDAIPLAELQNQGAASNDDGSLFGCDSPIGDQVGPLVSASQKQIIQPTPVRPIESAVESVVEKLDKEVSISRKRKNDDDETELQPQSRPSKRFRHHSLP